jgi:hypothetical protein
VGRKDQGACIAIDNVYLIMQSFDFLSGEIGEAGVNIDHVFISIFSRRLWTGSDLRQKNSNADKNYNFQFS